MLGDAGGGDVGVSTALTVIERYFSSFVRTNRAMSRCASPGSLTLRTGFAFAACKQT